MLKFFFHQQGEGGGGISDHLSELPRTGRAETDTGTQTNISSLPRLVNSQDRKEPQAHFCPSHSSDTQIRHFVSTPAIFSFQQQISRTSTWPGRFCQILKTSAGGGVSATPGTSLAARSQKSFGFRPQPLSSWRP